MHHPLFSRTVSASGVVLPENPPVTPIPSPVNKGHGGRLHAIHGHATTAGTLNVYDGEDNTGKLLVELPVAIGQVSFRPYGSHRFLNGVYVEFSTVVGSFMLTFC